MSQEMTPNQMANYRNNTNSVARFPVSKTRWCKNCRKRHSPGQFASESSTSCKKWGN